MVRKLRIKESNEKRNLIPLVNERRGTVTRRYHESMSKSFDPDFLKYYNQFSLEDIADELGYDFEDDLDIFQELEGNGYGIAVSGLLAKPEYEDALWDDAIGSLIIMDDGTVGYNYGHEPMYFDSVSIEEVEDCLSRHDLLDDDLDDEFDESLRRRHRR